MSKKRKVAALSLDTGAASPLAAPAQPERSPSSLPFDGSHLERFWDLASLNEKNRPSLN